VVRRPYKSGSSSWRNCLHSINNFSAEIGKVFVTVVPPEDQLTMVCPLFSENKSVKILFRIFNTYAAVSWPWINIIYMDSLIGKSSCSTLEISRQHSSHDIHTRRVEIMIRDARTTLKHFNGFLGLLINLKGLIM
jgi:hypothetical protein